MKINSRYAVVIQDYGWMVWIRIGGGSFEGESIISPTTTTTPLFPILFPPLHLGFIFIFWLYTFYADRTAVSAAAPGCTVGLDMWSGYRMVFFRQGTGTTDHGLTRVMGGLIAWYGFDL